MKPKYREDALEMRITFNERLLPSEQATHMMKQLDAALIQATGLVQTERGVNDPALYSIVQPAEARLPSQVRHLHDFVCHSVTQTPDRIALEFVRDLQGTNVKRARWTYKQLDDEGNKVANFLIVNGVRQGTIIAVCFDKCPEASFAMLGILKAGCGFLAIDPSAPPERKSYILEDSRAAALLTMNALAPDFEKLAQPPLLIKLDDCPDLNSAAVHRPRLDHPIKEDDTAYCLYTSGTTGKPKGCLITHLNVVQALLAFQRLFTWNISSRFLQFASFHFDVSVMEQYWSWSVGITCVSAPLDLIFEDLAGTIRDLGITHIDLTPSLARLIKPEEAPCLCTPSSVFITGGEALKQEIIDTWGSQGVIYNGYGPSKSFSLCIGHS